MGRSSTSPSTPTKPQTSEREQLILALTDDDLAKGKGSPSQLAAWRELEWRRICADPEYFFDHYGWIARKGGRIERWRLWPAQRELLRMWEQGTSSASLKARQLGVTTLDVNYKLWKTLTKDANRAFLLSDTQEKATEAITKMQITKDRLPAWMTERASRRLRETENRKAEKADAATKVKYGFSEFKVMTCTPNSAAGVSGDVTIDEAGRVRLFRRVLDNAMPAYEGGGVLTVIGNGNGEDDFFRLCLQAQAGDFPGMVFRFFWWGSNPERLEGALVRKKDGTVVDALTLTDKQCQAAYAAGMVTCAEFDAGKGRLCAPWYESESRKYPDMFAFKQQYPGTVDEAVYIQTAGFFRPEVVNAYARITHIAKMKAHEGMLERVSKEDGSFDSWKWHSNVNHTNTRLYHKPIEGQRYVAGVDPTGDGAKGDYAVIKVYRIIDDMAEINRLASVYSHDNPPVVEGSVPWKWEAPAVAVELCAVYQARTEPVAFVSQVVRLCEWYNDAYCVIERNNHGSTVIAHIKELYWNLYRDVDTGKFADETKDNIGYDQKEQRRQVMLDNLQAWIHSGRLFCVDTPTINEWGRFGYDEKGHLTHPKGSHDDLLFGDGLAIIGVLDLIINRSSGEDINYSVEW